MDAITHIGQLRPDARNARKHNPRNIGMIATALGEVGAARSIVIDEDGAILAGNGTVEAAAQAGIERVQVVDADGETIVAVRRHGLSDEQKIRLALFDNRTAELASWDPETLGEIAQEIDTTLMFSAEELLAALSPPPRTVIDPGPRLDLAEELQEQWQTARGQTWQAGPHRVVCGDATSSDDVTRLLGGGLVDLVVTDPPYGVGYVGKTADAMTISNDNLSEAGTRALVCDALRVAPLKPGGSFYVCSPAGPAETIFRLAIADAGLTLKQCLVWVKQHFVMGRQDYQWRHESILYGWRPGGAHAFYGGRWQDTVCDDRPDLDTISRNDAIEILRRFYDEHETTVWDIDRPAASRLHPTTKPTALMVRALTNSSVPGEVVYDPFVGSGTTIAAAEQEGRIAYAMELDPLYVAVTLERLAGMGLEPRLV